jgi:hypothetical protein
MPDANQDDTDQVSEKNNDTIKRFLGDYEDKKQDVSEADEKPDEKDVSDKQVEDKKTDEEAEEKFSKDDVEKTVAEAKKEVWDKIRSSAGMTDEEEKEMEDKGLIPPWEKEKRTPKTYREIAEFSAELAEHREKKRQDEAKKQQDEMEKQRQANEKQLNDIWDEQLEDLREAGKIPKIDPGVIGKIKAGKPLSEVEAKDPGLTAQRDLFNKMYEVAETRRKAGKPVSTNLKEIYYEHYQTPKKSQPAGADAPISGGASQINESDDDFTWKDIHGSSFHDIVKE